MLKKEKLDIPLEIALISGRKGGRFWNRLKLFKNSSDIHIKEKIARKNNKLNLVCNIWEFLRR
jgi:hypothetical protein